MWCETPQAAHSCSLTSQIHPRERPHAAPTPGSARAFNLRTLSPEAPAFRDKIKSQAIPSRISLSAPLRLMGLREGTFRTHTSAAPLKHRRHHRLERLFVSFRTHTSAAPLKLRLCSLIGCSIPPFRTHTSAAPLKRAVCLEVVQVLAPFRTHTSAAPLKPQGGDNCPASRRFLPHSHECGPVEALCWRPQTPASPALPHSHECGPVEALS